jgi:hypothetical protein
VSLYASFFAFGAGQSGGERMDVPAKMMDIIIDTLQLAAYYHIEL